MLRRALLGVGGVLAAVALAGLVPADAAPPRPSAPPTQDVRVTNTADDPVPVAAAQSGTWTVGINGTPSVSLAGTPTVNVGNFPTANPPPLWQGTPYVRSISGQLGCFSLPIPQDRALFVERAFASFGTGPSSTEPAVLVLNPLGGDPLEHLEIPTPLGSSDRHQGSVELGIPVTSMDVCSPSTVGYGFTVIGYLVPAPSAP